MNKIKIQQALLCITASIILSNTVLGHLSFLTLPLMLISAAFVVDLFFGNWKHRGSEVLTVFGYSTAQRIYSQNKQMVFEDYLDLFYNDYIFGFLIDYMFLVAAPYLFLSLSLVTLLSKIVHDSELTYPGFSPSMFLTLISNTISSDIEGLTNNRILGTYLLWAMSAIVPLGQLLSINIQLLAASVCLISTAVAAWVDRNKQIPSNTIILSDFATYNASTVPSDSKAKRALSNKPRFRRAYNFSGTKHDGSNVNIESCYLY